VLCERHFSISVRFGSVFLKKNAVFGSVRFSENNRGSDRFGFGGQPRLRITDVFVDYRIGLLTYKSKKFGLMSGQEFRGST